MVLRLRQHNIGYTADGFYRSHKFAYKTPQYLILMRMMLMMSINLIQSGLSIRRT